MTPPPTPPTPPASESASADAPGNATDTLDHLQQHNLGEALRLNAGPNGHPVIDIHTDACTGRLHLHGATVTDYQPAGHRPVLFTSDSAVFDGHTAIRGGVPVCFPWFAGHPTDPAAPAHGLVRTAPWKLLATSRDTDNNNGNNRRSNNGNADAVSAELGIDLQHLRANYRVRFADDLQLRFTATNTADTPQRFELALHTYLAVGDIHQVHIAGLENTDYLDNTQQRKPLRQGNAPLRFTEETDRVYVNTPADCVLTDPAWSRTLRVAKTGSDSTVVWNPWPEKSARLADLGDDAWQNFCCIETACIADNAITLAPGKSHTVTVTITAQAL